jgi:hypothetical protein
MHTPSFLIWALARHCPLRQIPGWENPERTERLLRAARAYDEARAEGRILDGIALAAATDTVRSPEVVLGFRVDEALRLYGGEPGLHAACDACPANALKDHRGRQVVGCFGMWPLPDRLDEFYEQVEAALPAEPLLREAANQTTPPWYGLWLDTPLTGSRALSIGRVLRKLRLDDPASAAGRDELVLALNAAAGGIPLHFLLYPPGKVEGQWWNLLPHCERCKAPWLRRGPCSVCGQTTHPASPKKRHVRGNRPYYSLIRLLGEAKAREFVARHRAQLRGGQ